MTSFHVREILLVASPYDAFVLGEDDRLPEVLFGEYQELQLSLAPRISRVSTAQEALSTLDGIAFDLVITMMRVGSMPVDEFAKAVHEKSPNTAVALLAYSPTDLQQLQPHRLQGIDRAYLWNGNVRILLAIIKQVEDDRNLDHDVNESGVQAVLLVEDSTRFYSYYLPQLYTAILEQTNSLIEEGINLRHRMLRMRARPKVLLASDYETATKLFEQHHDRLLGVITDVRFPKDGKLKDDAGFTFIRHIRAAVPDMPVLLQSSDRSSEIQAKALDCSFLAKDDPDLAEGFRKFLREHMGFGAFVFRTEDGTEVARASDLAEMVECLPGVPDASVEFHASRNHFSKWLLARTEFELAHTIRPWKTSEFAGPGELKSFLIKIISETLESRYAGSVTDFSPRAFSQRSPFMRIGTGSLGGKARGLGFLNSVLSRVGMRSPAGTLRVEIPRSTVIGSEVFEHFLSLNGFRSRELATLTDAELRHAFAEAALPDAVVSDLRELSLRSDYPLAVRSSSRTEDAQFQPTAGLYETYMLPNNHANPEIRLDRIRSAIRMVYASAFTERARARRAGMSTTLDQDEMSVILQRLVGRIHGPRFYPVISGVAQSRNYYPVPPVRAEDGVVNSALGLGATVVEDGGFHSFSPARPKAPLGKASARDWILNSQRSFLSLDMGNPLFVPAGDPRGNLNSHPISAAEEDGVLNWVASTYDAANDRLYDGIGRAGSRVVTFAPVLANRSIAFAPTMRWLLELSQQAVGCPVEIEFTLDPETPRLSVLQVRPMPTYTLGEAVDLDALDKGRIICASPRVLGHGRIKDIRDIVYVRPDTFQATRTRQIAAELAKVNAALKAQNRRYLLIGPGRWGTADPLLGIPVRWEQIDGAQAIVETTLDDFIIEPSSGTHFLHNVVSLGVGYFAVRHDADGVHLDWDWLSGSEAVQEGPYTRHLRMEKPLEIMIDGAQGAGAILKPEV